MNKTSQEIVHWERRQVEQMEAAVEKLRREQRELEDCCESIAAIWSGDSAEQFLRKLHALTEQLEQDGRALQDVASSLRDEEGADRIGSVE